MRDEIECLEAQAAFDVQLSAPTSRPVKDMLMTNAYQADVVPTGTDEYDRAF